MRRILSYLLAITLLFLALPLNVIAEEEKTDYGWANEEIQAFINKGYLKNNLSEKFDKDKAITRAEFVSIVNQAFDINYSEGENQFKDLEEDFKYYKDIIAATEDGYIKGYEDKTFKANTQITREEIASVLYNVMNITYNDIKDLKFKDKNSISSWAKKYISFLSEHKIINGYPDGNFKGKFFTTRAEAIKLIYEIEKNFKKFTGLKIINNGKPVNVKISKDEKVLFEDKIENSKEIKLASGNYALDFNGKKLNVKVRNNFYSIVRINEDNIQNNSIEVKEIKRAKDNHHSNYFINEGLNNQNQGNNLDNKKDEDKENVENKRNKDGKLIVNFYIEDKLYKSQSLLANELIDVPIAPEKEGYEFINWFEDKECKNIFDFSKGISNDTNIYAKFEKIGSNEVSYEDNSIERSSNPEENIISFMEIIDGKMRIELSSIEESLLQIKYFTEDNKEINDTIISIDSNSDSINIHSKLPANLPRYYVATACLLDQYGKVISNIYTFKDKTKSFDDLYNSSINDYPNNTVINFDDNEYNNFGVLKDNVIFLQKDSFENLINNNGIYTIKGLSWAFTDFAEDVNSFKSLVIENDSDLLYIRVKSIKKEADGSYTIIEEKDKALTDFYEVLKVNTDYKKQDEILNTLTQNRAVSYKFGEIVNKEIFINKKIFKKSLNIDLSGETKKKTNINISGTLETQADLKLQLYIKINVIGFKDNIFKYRMELDNEGKLNINGSVGKSKSKELKYTFEKGDKFNISKEQRLIKIPIIISGIPTEFEVNLELKGELNGGLEYELTFKNHISQTKEGFTGELLKNSSANRKSTLNVFGEGKVSVGLSIEYGIEIIDKMAETSVYVKPAGEMNLKCNARLHEDHKNSNHIHGCSLCCEGGLSITLSIGVKGELKITKNFHPEFDYNRELFKKEILTYFGSLKNDKESKYRGKVTFGKGECKNNKYSIKFIVKPKNPNYTVDKAQIINLSTGKVYYVDKIQNQKPYKDSEQVMLFLGRYKISVILNNAYAKLNLEKEFTIEDSQKTIYIEEGKKEGSTEVKGKILSSKDGKPIDKAKIELYHNGECIDTFKNLSDGTFKFDLQNGKYKIIISAEGFKFYSDYLHVNNDKSINLNNIYLTVNEYENRRGSLQGRVLDATNAQAIADANVNIMSNDSSNPKILYRAKTDDNGMFKFDIKEFKGKNYFGIKADNYRVKISKEGYSDLIKNITVLENEDLREKFLMNKIGSESEVRIVLEWGQYPYDLDSHLNTKVGNYTEHIYFRNKRGRFSDLDIDDTSSYGPETITIYDQNALTNGFTYYVHDYTNRYADNSEALSRSNAKVTLYIGGKFIKTYNVPIGKIGNCWKIFSINEDGNIEGYNEIYNVNDFINIGNGSYGFRSVMYSDFNMEDEKITELDKNRLVIYPENKDVEHFKDLENL